MLTVEHLRKSFVSGGSRVTAVDDVSFTLKTGTFAAIVGKSGSGKSTLLALLGALDRPTTGKITVDEVDITKLGDHQLTAYRRADIGFVFQQYNLVPNLTAIENVMLPMEFARVPASARKTRAAELLEQVGLDTAKQHRKPARLSGGEQQRVAIARALANRPKLILADEPTGNLDTQTGEQVFSLLHELTRAQKVTIIVVTHDLSIAGKCDEVLAIKDGKLIKTK
ncbi:MAG TPA: ABC transporter ATP-binding protein [Candidatus Saccharimonadales bacterium]|nr:ABC transporter ATP-binding protein [Candidatus Saccharimonadales bacterium]